jgi:ribosomal protein L22
MSEEPDKLEGEEPPGETPAAGESPAAGEAPAASDAPAEAEAEKPKPRRRRTRRRAEEPKAEESPAADETPAVEEPAAAEEPAPVEEDSPAEAPAPETARRASRPAPRRRRSAREPGQPAPVVRAQAKYVRSSARKARLVCDHIRGKSVDEARAILAMTPRAIARDWSKLLESAIANAEHNHELVGEDLYVKAVRADEGPTIKRFRPRAMGRATPIRKRTSHLTILLTPKD